MKQLNVGVIGVGFIGTLHIDAIRRLQGAHVLGICASNPSKLNALMEKHNIEVGYQHWKDMITDPRIDVIHNCTPNHLHDDINRAAIEAGKHIFSEKPLSLNADSAKELLDLAIEKKVAHGVNHQYRLNAAVQEIKEGVQKGDYGRPLFIRGHYLQESHTRKTDYSKRLVPETSPARALADIGSHIADIINCVMDMPIKSVFADMLTHHPYRYDPNTGYKIEVHSDDTTTEEIEKDYHDVANICIEQGALDVLISDTEERNEIIWKSRGAFLEAIKGSTTYMDEIDVVVPRSRVNALVEYTQEVEDKVGLRIKCFGHAGDGNLHIYLLKDDLSDEIWNLKMKEAMQLIYNKAHEFGGMVSGEHGIGYAKKPYLLEAQDPDVTEIMRKIKEAFDPKNVLNPNKIFALN
ncbi:MAG: Gfo/Idh/MocA family oxidoreductase [Clostridiales bacterium]|jgi:predicted dehydrogenase|nr:Gfo/Idh/MocA family oxidoreductase [Clostridiales bacterium]